jgi:pyruvate/2-oxoglutarate dehydrogenase complex dihydrolipoamide acyltransferase (E2) component
MLSTVTDVRLERTAPEMEYATIVRWLKREGETVVAGEVLLEVEADKATQEVVAPASGVLEEIYAPAGDEIRVGDVMGTIAARAEPGGSAA